jgi:threonine/homoserine/homoserine lactone efflux protein
MDSIVALIVATAVLLGSPGPAPLALAACSASFGIKKSLPFLFGILLGLSCAILGAIFGVAVLLASYPGTKIVVQIIGAGYLLYVAYKIAMAPVIGEQDKRQDIPTLLDGFILNLLNPKAYAAFFAIFSQFQIESGSMEASLLLTAVISFSVAVIVDYIWLLIGGGLREIFKEPKSARIIRVTFGTIITLLVVVSFIV